MGEDGVEYSFHAGSVTEDPHGPGPAPDLYKASFDSIGGSGGFSPLFVFEDEEAQQVVEVFLEA